MHTSDIFFCSLVAAIIRAPSRLPKASEPSMEKGMIDPVKTIGLFRFRVSERTVCHIFFQILHIHMSHMRQNLPTIFIFEVLSSNQRILMDQNLGIWVLNYPFLPVFTTIFMSHVLIFNFFL
jgi:hypothetical protein